MTIRRCLFRNNASCYSSMDWLQNLRYFDSNLWPILCRSMVIEFDANVLPMHGSKLHRCAVSMYLIYGCVCNDSFRCIQQRQTFVNQIHLTVVSGCWFVSLNIHNILATFYDFLDIVMAPRDCDWPLVFLELIIDLIQRLPTFGN
jgi:hypothetical protein